MKIKKYETKYHSYIFIFPYDAAAVAKVKEVQKRFGWGQISYHQDEKVRGWAFSDLQNVLPALLGHFTIDISDEVLSDIQTGPQEQNMDDVAISVEDLRTDLDLGTTKPLFPFQVKAVDFVEKAGGKALIADDMGLGKTAEAIGYGCYKRYPNVLVVCPASVKENWKREIMAFAGIDAKILTDEDPGGWEIIGYSNLEKYMDYLKKRPYDLIILDEAHYVKNRQAKRTKAMFKILKTAKDVIFLTGTPILNRPLEVYPVFNFISPMKFWDFAQRYCGAKETNFGWDYNGASHLDELKERMWWMIRREKKEVLTELPDKTINVLTTNMSDWSEYNKALNDFRSWLLENDLGTQALYAEALTKASYLKQICVKNKNIKDIIDDFLDNGKKIIVFSQYKETINYLYEIYENISVRLTGDTPVEDRQALVDNFQSNENTRIFFSTIKAGGVGITLTAADTVLFTDLSWTPADHHQAEDRAYRIGQKNNVNVYYLLTPKTIEEKIWKMLRRKEKMVNQIMAGEENVRKVHIKSLLKSL